MTKPTVKKYSAMLTRAKQGGEGSSGPGFSIYVRPCTYAYTQVAAPAYRGLALTYWPETFWFLLDFARNGLIMLPEKCWKVTISLGQQSRLLGPSAALASRPMVP